MAYAPARTATRSQYRQLRHGDWTARPEGELFRRVWFDERFLDERDLPERLRLCRYWDLAATEPRTGSDPDHTAGVLLGRSPDGLCYVIDLVRIEDGKIVEHWGVPDQLGMMLQLGLLPPPAART